jgi:hypothetical protein
VRRLIVDTGPLVALANEAERQHQPAVEFFDRFDGALLTTVAIVTEVCALLPRRKSHLFLRSIAQSNFALVHVPEQELSALAALMEKYSDRPMDFADASLLWLADALGLADVATLDSGFHIYRTRRGRALRNRFP